MTTPGLRRAVACTAAAKDASCASCASSSNPASLATALTSKSPSSEDGTERRKVDREGALEAAGGGAGRGDSSAARMPGCPGSGFGFFGACLGGMARGAWLRLK